MSLHKAQAVVLRRIPGHEKDLVAHLLLDTGEQIYLRLHGILASKNRSPLIAEPGSLIDIDYYAATQERQEVSFKEGSVLKRHDRLKADYPSQTLLAKILLLSRLTSAGATDVKTFQLAKAALAFADDVLLYDKAPTSHQSEAFLIFLCIRCFSLMGLLGDTDHCANCNATLSQKQQAVFGDGMFFLCHSCNPLADTVGFQCSVEVSRALKNRYRNIQYNFENIDEEVFLALKAGIRRALAFTLPQAGQLFD